MRSPQCPSPPPVPFTRRTAGPIPTTGYATRALPTFTKPLFIYFIYFLPFLWARDGCRAIRRAALDPDDHRRVREHQLSSTWLLFLHYAPGRRPALLIDRGPIGRFSVKAVHSDAFALFQYCGLERRR